MELLMKLLSVFVYLKSSVAYQDTTNCGFQRVELAPEFSITGGGLAQEGEWPWQVALLYGDSFLCGGQLIKEDWVLTASHCITHLNDPTGHQIMMGSIHLNNFTDNTNTQIKTVAEIYAHPDYSTLISDFDLALLQLQEPFEMTDYVTTICLAKRGMESIYEPGTAVTVTGWGAKRDMGPLPKTLHEVTIPMVEHETCRTMYLGEDNISTNMICAAPVEGGKGSCGGDSGGPLVTKIGDQWWLAGTVLGGNGCGSPDFPNVFQNVIAFQNWIDPVFSNRIPLSQTTRCEENQFSCKEGWCVDYWRRCNVREDCMLSTDELYCEGELKLFDVHFYRRLSYRNIIRNITVPNSRECAKMCVKTIVPMKCGAFDTTPGENNTRICSLGSEAYSTKRVSFEEQTRDKVSHFTYRFTPVPGTEITQHIGMILSPNLLSSKRGRTGYFNWVFNLDAPNSNTIVFTMISVKSSVDNCEKIGNMAMLVVKPGKGKRRNRKKNKKEGGAGANYCLGELQVGDEFRVHSIQAKLVFYTTHTRRFAFSLEYKPEYNCTKTLTSPKRLKTPNYPAKYPPSLQCKWTYRAPPGMVVSITMDDFFVEKVPACEFDYVQIFDGNSTDAPQLTGPRCGRTWTDTIRSTGNQMLIVFVSDSEVMKTGFNADIDFVRTGRRASQRLVVGDQPESGVMYADQLADTPILLFSLWGTVVGCLFIITVMGVVCYKLKKRLDTANALVHSIKRNNVVLDSH